MSAIDHNTGNTYAHREVPVESLRLAFVASGMSKSEVARRLGWTRPDTARLSRQLGLTSDQNSRTDPARRRATVSLERAYEILEALGIDPVDVGL